MGKYNEFELDLRNVKVEGNVQFGPITQDSINSCAGPSWTCQWPTAFCATKLCTNACTQVCFSRYAETGNEADGATAC